MKILILSFCALLFFSCSKDNNTSIPLDGIYKGSYFKDNVFIATISIHFNKGSYEGSSSKEIPLIVSGVNLEENKRLSFASLSSISSIDVLSGDFSYEKAATSLTFTKTQDGIVLKYDLKKQ